MQVSWQEVIESRIASNAANAATILHARMVGYGHTSRMPLMPLARKNLYDFSTEPSTWIMVYHLQQQKQQHQGQIKEVIAI
jgi:hypothetical protein